MTKDKQDLNWFQIYFLKYSDPFYTPEIKEKDKVSSEFSTGMSVDFVKEQFKKMGVNYDKAKRLIKKGEDYVRKTFGRPNGTYES